MTFEKQHFPTIKLLPDSIDIKSRDFGSFRHFKFSDIINIEYININDKWYSQLYDSTSIAASIFRDLEPSFVQVNLKNGGDWGYECPNKKDRELIQFLKIISPTPNTN